MQVLQTIGSILGFLLIMLVLGLVFDPAATQAQLISLVNVFANVYHAAQHAFQ
jgi:hypothetical protein